MTNNENNIIINEINDENNTITNNLNINIYKSDK